MPIATNLAGASYYKFPFASSPRRVASRSSRISLPDEARRYYKNYSDSPLPPPHANATGSEGWTQSQPHVQLYGANGERTLSQIPEEGVSRSNDLDSPRPFLDLETIDDNGSERRPSSETRRQKA